MITSVIPESGYPRETSSYSTTYYGYKTGISEISAYADDDHEVKLYRTGYSFSDGGWQSYAFDNTIEPYGWYTGIVYNEDGKYIGDAQYNSINGISGEWVGWYYNYPVSLTGIRIYPNYYGSAADTYRTRFAGSDPSGIVLFGSNDDTNWTLLNVINDTFKGSVLFSPILNS